MYLSRDVKCQQHYVTGVSPKDVNCITTMEGMYQFTYEVGGSISRGGICNNSNSMIAACQDPGSAYVDNKYFQMNYSRCHDVSTSKDQGTFFKHFKDMLHIIFIRWNYIEIRRFFLGIFYYFLSIDQLNGK